MITLSYSNMAYVQKRNYLHKCWTLEDCICYALENNIELNSEKMSLGK